MEEKINYFFDSYAIIEIIKENQNYRKYLEEDATITIFNLAEIYWSVLNYFEEDKAEVVYEKYKGATVEIPDEVLKKSIKFRKEHKKQNLSYTDCIGYIYAKENGMKFLTGDKEFKDFENVEFVK